MEVKFDPGPPEQLTTRILDPPVQRRELATIQRDAKRRQNGFQRTNLLLCLVDKCDLLAQVEAVPTSQQISCKKPPPVCGRIHGPPQGGRHVLGSLDVVDALDLDQARLRVSRVPTPLVAQVPGPARDNPVSHLSIFAHAFDRGSGRCFVGGAVRSACFAPGGGLLTLRRLQERKN